MADEKKDVEVKLLDRCPEHGVGRALIRDAEGDTRVALLSPADPDFPSQHTLGVTEERTEDGWHRGTLKTRRGPVLVTSDAYRRGWERVFGNKTTEGEA